MGLFKRGYEATRAEKKRQDEEAKRKGNRLFRFFISAGNGGEDNEADIRFLTEQPVSFSEHTVKEGDRYTSYTCSGPDCPLCASGDRPTMKGAYLIIDKRKYSYTDKNGKTQEGDKQLRLFVQGMRVISQLDRISLKYGLSNRDVTIVRMGSGTSTTYTIERGDKSRVTQEEVKELMTEDMASKWDGSQNGLMDIIEEQLKMNFKNPNDFTAVNNEEETMSPDGRGDIISVDEEEPPKKSSKLKFGKNKSTFKKKETIKEDEMEFYNDDDEEV